MRIPALLVVGLVLAGCGEPPPPPNIVLVVADDLGWGELGSYGQTKIRTPNLDRLATEGMRFTNFYSGSPVCAPSRCVLLTGLHTGNAYIRRNDETAERGDVWNDPALEGNRPIPPETLTLAEVLKEEGYATAAVGKWGLGWPGSAGDPNFQGFDLFYGYNCQRMAHNYYPTHMWHNQEKELLDNPAFKARSKLPPEADPNDSASYAAYKGNDFAPDFMLSAAERFIRTSADGGAPFFLYYPSPIPHLALQIPDKELEAYEGEWEEAPYVGGKGYLPHQKPRAAYAAMISRLDREVGVLMETLEELGMAENTLFIFTSDNGPSWVGGVDRVFFESSGGLRGRKAQLLEGGIRVPMIARWPGRIRPGSTSSFPSAFQDLMPTICEAVEMESGIPVGLDGISLLPVLRGEGRSEDFTRSIPLYWEYQNRRALRRGDWKIYQSGHGQPWHLYNLKDDTSESKDLAKENPELLGRLIAEADATRSPSRLYPLKGVDGPFEFHVEPPSPR